MLMYHKCLINFALLLQITIFVPNHFGNHLIVTLSKCSYKMVFRMIMYKSCIFSIIFILSTVKVFQLKKILKNFYNKVLLCILDSELISKIN